MHDAGSRHEWGLFLDDLVHELRTPLTAIGGYAALLTDEEQDLSPLLRHAVDVIDAQSERLGAQLAVLLDIARLWSGRRPLRARRLDVAAVARAAAKRHRVAIESDGPAWSHAERSLIRRAVDILVDNALHHGRPPVSVAMERVAGSVCVTVSDAGPGVPATRAPLIGRRPFQSGGAERQRAGTGLGLVLAAAIAERHGGALVYDGPPGRTSFTLRLSSLP